MTSKKPWLSKTLWIALVTAAVPLFPPAAAVVAANPAAVGAAVGLVFAGLRLISHGQITLSDD
jgi:hypothetical protein